MSQPRLKSGYYWCRTCARATEPEDAGDPWPVCSVCGHRTVTWRPRPASPARHATEPLAPGCPRALELFAALRAAATQQDPTL